MLRRDGMNHALRTAGGNAESGALEDLELAANDLSAARVFAAQLIIRDTT
jgi:hypothetical protein